MPEAHDKDYFLAKARQCFRLADGCTDPKLALLLRQLGLEFVSKALKLGADRAEVPRPWRAPESEC